jgi:hypothetical protein
MSETNEGVAVAPEATEETEQEVEKDVVTLSKDEYSKLNETLGSLKRENKQLKKPKEEPVEKETPKKTEPDGPDLQTLGYLEMNQITADEDVELAIALSEKWEMPMNKLVKDEDFKVRLEKERDKRATVDATSNVKGDKSKSTSKTSVEYWLAKGEYPTTEQMPDRKERAKVARAMQAEAKQGKTFYNE